MLRFEEYLADFTNTVSLADFIINLIVASLLSLALKAYYIRFGTSISNRQKFASVFVPLALTTLLVITVVKASIALSLGLVGALSIVRFRAAIKEPEELTYLFMAIGIGLVTGANKPLLAILAMALIFPLLYLNQIFRQKGHRQHNKMFVNIESKQLDLKKVSDVLENALPYIELKRYDTNETRQFFSFIVRADSLSDIETVRQELAKLDTNIDLSIVDQPDLIL